MNVKQAEQAINEIETLMRKYGLWYVINREHKPDLKTIEIKGTIKIQ